MTIARALVFGSAVVGLAGAACDDKKESPKLAAVASALAPSVTPDAAAFVVDPASVTTMTLEAPQLTIKAKTDRAAGKLDVDFADVTRSRGDVKIDLTTLTLSTFGDEAKDRAQTTDARTWLEVGGGHDGKPDDATKEQHRYAVYAIRAIESATPTDVAKIAPIRDGADEVRTLALTTKGDLLVHGRKVEREAEVDVTLRYDPGAPPDRPKALAATSRKPLRVVLAEHDVKPRDNFGKIAKGSFHLLGTKVADIADIRLDLRARPKPQP